MREDSEEPAEGSLPILVVDDDELISQMLSFMLRHSGFEAETAPNGVAALERASERDFALFVLDNMMPGMTGLDLARELVARGHATKQQMVMMTGGPVPDGASQLVDTVMLKPFEVDELIGVLRRLAAGER